MQQENNNVFLNLRFGDGQLSAVRHVELYTRDPRHEHLSSSGANRPLFREDLPFRDEKEILNLT